jgi:hypothetical protein
MKMLPVTHFELALAALGSIPAEALRDLGRLPAGLPLSVVHELQRKLGDDADAELRISLLLSLRKVTPG